jgi:hypothetical protein
MQKGLGFSAVKKLSNSTYTLRVHKKIRCLLKSPYDQNHHLINHTFNGDFKSHFTFLWTLNTHIKLLKKNYNTYVAVFLRV